MKIKLNYKKIQRNIFIIIFILLLILYIDFMTKYNNIVKQRYANFVEYAKAYNVKINKDNYIKYCNP